MVINVRKKTLPVAGVDNIDITIEETYLVDGIGEDTVILKGTLVSERTSPLLGYGENTDSWETSTVVARFNKLLLYGESSIFGPVIVTLDESAPSFGVVKNGKCAAALPIQVQMPKHNLLLRSEEPVQLRSDVQTVPPIGDEKTESVHPVKLLNVKTMRPIGNMLKAKVAWRELTEQTISFHKDRVALSMEETDRNEVMQEKLNDLTNKVDSILQSLNALATEIKRK